MTIPIAARFARGYVLGLRKGSNAANRASFEAVDGALRGVKRHVRRRHSARCSALQWRHSAGLGVPGKG